MHFLSAVDLFACRSILFIVYLLSVIIKAEQSEANERLREANGQALQFF